MTRLALALLLAVTPGIAEAQVPRPKPVADRCAPMVEPVRMSRIRVVDGDTLVAVVEGIGPDRVRLARIDTPELRARCVAEKVGAERAREALSRALEAAGVVTVQSSGCGRYGRLIGEVYADGVNVNDALVRAGLARIYRGRREGWCE